MSKTATYTIILIFTTIFSKVLGFAREQVLAYFYGTSATSDMFTVAFSIPNVIVTGLGTAILTCFIPIYTDLEKNNPRQTKTFSDNVTTIVVMLCILIYAVFLIFDTAIVKLFAPGFDAELLQRTTEISRIMMASIIFICAYFLLQAFLQIRGSFFVVGITSLPLNIAVITAIALSATYGDMTLAYGTLIGYIATYIMFFFTAKRRKFSYRPYLDFKDKNLRRLIVVVIPIFLGKSITQINIMIDRMIASGLPEGNITALGYANRVTGFVTSVFVVSVATAIFPHLARLNVDKNIKKLKSTFISSVGIMSLLVLPISAGIAIFAEEIVIVLFMRGAFSQESLEVTSGILRLYSIGLLAFSIKDVALNVFYATGDTKTPAINSGIALGINIVLNLALVRVLGAKGLSLATSISGIITLIILLVSMRKRYGLFGAKKLVKSMCKMLIATGVMAVTVIPTYNLFFGLWEDTLIALLLAVGIGALVYLIVNLLLKTRELAIMIIGFCEKFKIGV